MRKVNLGYAKDHLESLVDEAIAGEEVVIASKSARLVRLIPIEGERSEAGETSRKSRRARIETLVSDLRSLPDLDERSAEEILGYDERGLF
jgi:antitoxin (DNA-binding transcriptional repressor) of toxin-antitoxin stability system